jgi:hypothetical protein
MLLPSGMVWLAQGLAPKDSEHHHPTTFCLAQAHLALWDLFAITVEGGPRE